MVFTYTPKGVCSRQFQLEIEDNRIQDIRIIGGCAGNTVGLAKLAIGYPVDEVIERLEGIPCGFRGTSCPDQLAKALKAWKEQHAS